MVEDCKLKYNCVDLQTCKPENKSFLAMKYGINYHIKIRSKKPSTSNGKTLSEYQEINYVKLKIIDIFFFLIV